jgi:hypothetical protein
MASKAQRKATKLHRLRTAARGLVRLEVQAAKGDVHLIKGVAATLRERSKKSKQLRSTLATVLGAGDIRTAFDVFGSDLPDETFAGVFEQLRQQGWREVKL